jgi:POT family proton-dependent oligopeptide transporter
MFKGHPKGLWVFLFANMGERFGYYTMLAIFVLFLQAKFGMTATEAGKVYGYFLFGIYFIPLLGGYLADKILGFNTTISLGILLMIGGYFMLAQPGFGLYMVYGALAIISVGTGFFKGNLQALVGKLYDDANYNKYRDAAFSVFYMGINVGAFFAPSAANAMSNWIMGSKGLSYNANIPALANQYLNTGNVDNAEAFTELAKSQIVEGGGYQFTDLATYSRDYVEALSASYNWGFGIAAVSITISLLIYLAFRSTYKHVIGNPKRLKREAAENTSEKNKVLQLTPEQTRKRLVALGLLFIVNIFFWMAFHQNGFTLTIFARDYTVTEVNRFTYILFDLKALIPIIAAIIGVVFLLGKKNSGLMKMIGGGLLVAGSLVAYYSIASFSDIMPISPMLFQHFNPIFIVFVTPIIISIFAALNKRGKEPSSPRKIGIGLLIAGASFLIMVYVSYGMGVAGEFQSGPLADLIRVSPYWLVATYFMLTISELFYSPIGISFVSKVAPPSLSGLMQGGWLGSTAIGNLLAGLIGPFWDKWEMWQFFLLLVAMLILSSVFIFAILRILEQATEE